MNSKFPHRRANMRERANECAHDKADEFMDTEGNDAVMMYLNKESRSILKRTIYHNEL